MKNNLNRLEFSENSIQTLSKNQATKIKAGSPHHGDDGGAPPDNFITKK